MPLLFHALGHPGQLHSLDCVCLGPPPYFVLRSEASRVRERLCPFCQGEGPEKTAKTTPTPQSLRTTPPAPDGGACARPSAPSKGAGPKGCAALTSDDREPSEGERSEREGRALGGEGSEGEGSEGEGSEGEGSEREGSEGEGSEREGSEREGSEREGSEGEATEPPSEAASEADGGWRMLDGPASSSSVDLRPLLGDRFVMPSEWDVWHRYRMECLLRGAIAGVPITDSWATAGSAPKPSTTTFFRRTPLRSRSLSRITAGAKSPATPAAMRSYTPFGRTGTSPRMGRT